LSEVKSWYEAPTIPSLNINFYAARFARALAPELEDWKAQLEDIKKKEESCKNYREIMEGEKNFQKENVLASTKVDTEYRDCGQWLIDSNEFVTWRAGGGPSILWLRGTGKLLYLQLIACMLPIHD
jgi:hypothetical protein